MPIALQRPDKISRSERIRVTRLIMYGFFGRYALAIFFFATNLDYTLRLTKDGFFYDNIGKQIAQYYRTNGSTPWPTRVTGVFDFLFEHIVGLLYFMTDDSMLALRTVTCIAGALVPLTVWRMARYVVNEKIAYRSALWAAFFPTQFYYSALPVRDSLSTLALMLVFLGMVAIAAKGKLRDILGLPVGLLITGGFRAYMLTTLALVIPVAWLLTAIISPSKLKSVFIIRAISLLAVVAIIGVMFGLQSAFTTGKSVYLMDLDSWNHIRMKMNHGAGAMYSDGDIPELGTAVLESIEGVLTGIYFFFVSVKPTEFSSIRQFMAIPEVLIVLYMIPSMYRGTRRILRHHRLECAALLLVAAAITFGYSSVTTNGGPLMRWRLQVVNIYIFVAAIGWPKNYSPGLQLRGFRRPASARLHAVSRLS